MLFNVIVFCGAKCGSMTLNKTFEHSLHIHNNITMKLNYPELKFQSVEELILSQNVCYVIDSYRDLIERSISSLFQNIQEHIGEDYANIDNKLINLFLSKVYDLENYHPLDEIYPILKDIPFESKYIIHKEKGKTFIKLRFKDIEHWAEYLSEIFNTPITLIAENLTDNKEYADKYREFKKNVKITQEMFDFYTTHPLFIKYNSQSEQEEYKHYWSEKIVTNDYFNDVEFTRIPNDFNIDAYKNNNEDLNEMNEFELKYHYQFYGYKEKRNYLANV